MLDVRFYSGALPLVASGTATKAEPGNHDVTPGNCVRVDDERNGTGR